MTGFIRSLLLLALLCLAAPAHAQEKIFSFDADITVNADGSLDVTETIRVLALGYDIKRGIFRDIPMRRLAPSGLWDRNGFSIEAIRHNGEKSKYHTEWIGDFIRIYIGDADVLIPTGEHTYEIVYNTTNQLRFFGSYDELYWNVTGNFWTFPIEKATATVRLPQGAVAQQESGYTGYFGSSGPGAYTTSGAGRNEISFATTQQLAANEGLTVAVGFSKGVVQQSAAGPFITNLLANSGAILFGLAWLIVPFYYLIAWWRVGRDPPGETVIPLFHPPENLSPAAMSYVHFKSFRQVGRGASLAFIAALLALGVKKLLVIDEQDKGVVTFRRGGQPKVEPGQLPPGERSLYISLLHNRDGLTLNKSNGPILKRALDGLQSTIRSEYAGKFYRHNWGWLVPGIALAVVGLVGGLILQQPPDAGMASVMPALFSGLIGSGLLLFGWRTWTTPGGRVLWRIAGGLMMVLGVAVILLGLQGVLWLSSLPLYQAGGLLVMFGLLVIASMIHLLGAPTFEGAKVLSRIEGFKLYLETAETNRMNMREAPQMSEELFERFLPYAAGLGVEEPWSRAFAAHLSRIHPGEDHDRYRPAWYSGRNWDAGALARATTASVAAVSAAMASSMPQPKSSSGSSGGGFSGGGGGGGGGGGW